MIDFDKSEKGKLEDLEREKVDKVKKQGFPAYDDGYLTCNKCEKRWLAHDVHHEESMTKTEREKFLQGKGCPYCSGSEKVLEEMDKWIKEIEIKKEYTLTDMVDELRQLRSKKRLLDWGSTLGIGLPILVLMFWSLIHDQYLLLVCLGIIGIGVVLFFGGKMAEIEEKITNWKEGTPHWEKAISKTKKTGSGLCADCWLSGDCDRQKNAIRRKEVIIDCKGYIKRA